MWFSKDTHPVNQHFRRVGPRHGVATNIVSPGSVFVAFRSRISAGFQLLGSLGSCGIEQLFEAALLVGGEAGQDPLIGYLHGSVGTLQQRFTAAGEPGRHCSAHRR